MDWNDILTLVIAIDTILKLPALPVGGYFLWRWWRGRKRVEREEPLLSSRPNDTMLPLASGNGGVVVTTTGQPVQWIGYEERKPE